MNNMPTSNTAGIDWSWQQHAVCIVDSDGNRVHEFKADNTRAGMAMIAKALHRHHVTVVGIERGDGLLVEHFMRHDFDVVVIAPNQMTHHRARYGSVGNKDDRFDAYVLADLLRTDRHRWPVLAPDTDQTQAIRAMWRAYNDVTGHRIAVLNQLLALLQAHFPGANDLFSELDNKISLAFLTRFPTASSARWLTPDRMASWLKKQHYSGKKPASYFTDHLAAAPAGVCGHRAEVNAQLVAANVALLRSINDQQHLMRAELKRLVHAHPDGHIYLSFPKVGVLRAAGMISEIGDCRAKYPNPASLAAAAGVAPSTRQSGGSKHVSFRHGCNKHLRRVLTDWAADSRHRNDWAADTYDRARARGKKHPQAVRITAQRWAPILWHCWQDHTPYDPTQHRALQALTNTTR